MWKPPYKSIDYIEYEVFQKDLIVWKQSTRVMGVYDIPIVSEGLNSVETNVFYLLYFPL